MVKIYTKTGDCGLTSLFNGERVSKANECIAALGAIDECNCAIGTCIASLPKEDSFLSLHEELMTIQHALFDLGAAVATPRTRAVASKLSKTRFDNEATQLLEKWIDEREKDLQPLKTFIIPGGHPASAFLHLARAICRRAERHSVPLFEHADISEDVLIYLNRLSDYLFMAARSINVLAGCPDLLWRPHSHGS